MRVKSSGLILVVDDDANIRRALATALTADGYRVETAPSLGEAQAKLEGVVAILADMEMPGGSGLKLLDCGMPCLLLTERPGLPATVAAMRAGAYDVFAKPLDLVALRASLKSALAQPKALQPKALALGDIDTVVAESSGMKSVLATVAQVAPSRATVMIFGESGVGKEVIARALHRASPRASGPFAPISCAAIPETLLESELFGYEKGAFTGASGGKPGKFEAAGGGTLFLDEVGEIPLSVQAKLLRVIQEREIERLGSLGRIPIDVRVVTATHRDLHAAVGSGTFRLDLLYRLQVVEITVPPLRDRPEDVLPLAERALARFAHENGRAPLAIGPETLRTMQEHTWPGNVRELENAMERATVLSRGGELLWTPPRLLRQAA